MPTYTLTATGSSNYSTSQDASNWLTCRTMPSPIVNSSSADFIVGASTGTGYFAREAALEFDTSTIPVGESVDSATLSLYGALMLAEDGFYTVEVFARTSGQNVIPGATLATATILASKNTSGWSNGSYNTITSNGTAMATAVVRAGFTYLLVATSGIRSTTGPTQRNIAHFKGNLDSGTKPKLVVVTTVVTPPVVPGNILAAF